MRFNINLASQPYQDVQRFFVRSGIALLAVALLTAGLLYATANAVLSWRVTVKEAGFLRNQIADRDRQKAEAEAFLGRPENSHTRDRSQFLNLLISRKAFSWTEVFSDFEQMVPHRVHVTAIKPEVNEQGQLEVKLSIAGPNRADAVEMVRRLEASPHFSSAQIVTESQVKDKEVEIVKFEIVAIYIPSFARPGPAQKSAEKQSAAPQTEARNAGH